MADFQRSPFSREAFRALVVENLPDNQTGSITPSDVRLVFDGLADSTLWHDEFSSGPSAYDVAVAEGFSGDVTAWLTSLVGPAGEIGQTGPKGDPGADGTMIKEVRSVVGSYVSVRASDEGVAFLADADEVTHIGLPDDASAPLRVGAIVHVIQNGVGAARFIAEGSARLQTLSDFKPETRAQFGAISAVKVAPDTWRVHGDAALAEVSGLPGVYGDLSGVLQTTETKLRLSSAHRGAMIETLAGDPVSIVVSVDPALPIGTVVRIVQAGTGSVHLSTEPGTFVLHCASRLPESSGRNGVIVLYKSAADTWRATGDLALVRAFA